MPDGAHSVTLEGVVDDRGLAAAIAKVEGPRLDELTVKMAAPLGTVGASRLGAVHARVLNVRFVSFADRAEGELEASLAANARLVGLDFYGGRFARDDPEGMLERVQGKRASAGYAPLEIIFDEEEARGEDEDEDEDASDGDDDDVVECDGAGCAARLRGDDEMYTFFGTEFAGEGAIDLCVVCAGSEKGAPEGARPVTAAERLREQDAADADADDPSPWAKGP